MSEASNEGVRVAADGETTTTPSAPTPDIVEADVPGEKPENYVVLTLSNPLNEQDRMRLGLPLDASTEVGQKVKVNKSGANSIISAGYATVDPEDNVAVREALTGQPADQPLDSSSGQVPSISSGLTDEEKAAMEQGGEPTAAPAAEAPQADVINDVTPASAEVPPQEVPIAESTPGSPTPGAEAQDQEAQDRVADDVVVDDTSTTSKRRR